MTFQNIELKNDEIDTDFKGWAICLKHHSSRHSASVFELSFEGKPPVHLVCLISWPMPTKQYWTADGLKYSECETEIFGQKYEILIGDEKIYCGSFFLATNFAEHEYICGSEQPNGNVEFASWRPA